MVWIPSRATANADRLAIDPPLVMMPPPSLKPKRSRNHEMTLSSMAVAAGERVQRLQFWLSAAATASANGATPVGDAST